MKLNIHNLSDTIKSLHFHGILISSFINHRDTLLRLSAKMVCSAVFAADWPKLTIIPFNCRTAMQKLKFVCCEATSSSKILVLEIPERIIRSRWGRYLPSVRQRESWRWPYRLSDFAHIVDRRSVMWSVSFRENIIIS